MKLLIMQSSPASGYFLLSAIIFVINLWHKILKGTLLRWVRNIACRQRTVIPSPTILYYWSMGKLLWYNNRQTKW